MKKEYDFSKGKRGAVLTTPKGKKRITIRLDNDVIDWFLNEVDSKGQGNYQTMINDALKEYIRNKDISLEDSLRKIVREELHRQKQKIIYSL